MRHDSIRYLNKHYFVENPIKHPVGKALSIDLFPRQQLTRAISRPTISLMNDTTSKMNRLEDQVDQLLELCKRLGEENKQLRSQFKQLSSERSSLIEHKEQARTQVEAMITRLRSMENA